jgi:hypothetical protein
MAYVSQQDKKEIAPVVKNILKKYNLKGSLSVRNRSTLVLTIKSGEIDFINNYNNNSKEKFGDQGHIVQDYIDINRHWVDHHFTGEAKECLEELVNALKGPRYYDNSDLMHDYFDTSHYISINIGKWDKPYELIK